MNDFSKNFAKVLSKQLTPPPPPPPPPRARRRRGWGGGPSFEPVGPIGAAPSLDKEASRPAPLPEMVLQLCAAPIVLDINEYKNPHSSSNPTGSYQSAFRLSRLANNIPKLTKTYNNSPYKLESLWDDIIQASSSSPYTTKLLSKAQSSFKNWKLSGMGGVRHDWHPVDTIPTNWYDLLDDQNHLINLTINSSKSDDGNDGFIVLDGGQPLVWNSLNNSKKSPGQQIASSNIKIHLKILKVDFLRPWLDFELLHQKNWKIDGLEKGYFSSGQLENNLGIFPLLPQSMLIGSMVKIEGDFDQKDLNIINNHKDKDLTLGPFMIAGANNKMTIEQTGKQTAISSNIHQIVGFISHPIPQSPAL